MTLLIAAKCGPGLKPNGTTLTFEPGIVVAADTRLSYADGTSVDVGLKVGIAGPRAICAMSSDNIAIPSQAFYHFDGFMQDHPDISSSEAVVQLQHLLGEAHYTIVLTHGEPPPKTSVFLGHSDPSTGLFSLYRLDSKDKFSPEIRDGYNAAGSHAEWVLESSERIKHEYPTLRLRPFEGFPDNKVTVRRVACLVITLIDSALEVARGTESGTGRKQAIGGAVQAAIITAEGPTVFDPAWYEGLQAWQVQKGQLG